VAGGAFLVDECCISDLQNKVRLHHGLYGLKERAELTSLGRMVRRFHTSRISRGC
jgi:hypothetical protein